MKAHVSRAVLLVNGDPPPSLRAALHLGLHRLGETTSRARRCRNSAERNTSLCCRWIQGGVGRWASVIAFVPSTRQHRPPVTARATSVRCVTRVPRERVPVDRRPRQSPGPAATAGPGWGVRRTGRRGCAGRWFSKAVLQVSDAATVALNKRHPPLRVYRACWSMNLKASTTAARWARSITAAVARSATAHSADDLHRGSCEVITRDRLGPGRECWRSWRPAPGHHAGVCHALR